MYVSHEARPDDPTAEDDHCLVRPFVLTRGRVRPVHHSFDLVTMVTAANAAPPPRDLMPEHLAVIGHCQGRALSVAEIGAYLHLPLGTVRVLVDDLLKRRLIRVSTSQSAMGVEDNIRVLEAVIKGLRAL